MKKSFYARHALTIMAVSVFLLPFAVIGSLNAKKANKNDVKNWVPAEYPETQLYKAFREKFQGEEFILVSWRGCTLSDDRLELLAKKMLPPVEVKPKEGEPFIAYDLGKAQRMLADDEGPFKLQDAHYSNWELIGDNQERIMVWPAEIAADPRQRIEAYAVAQITRQRPKYYKSILTGNRVVDQMEAPPLKLNEQEIIQRLTGSLFGEDRRRADLVSLAENTTIADEVFLRRITLKVTKADPTPDELNEFLKDESPDKRIAAIDALLARDPDLQHRQTCLVATLTEGVLKDKALAVNELRRIAIDECAIPAAELHLGGPPVDNVAIDVAGQKSLNMLAGFAVAIGFVVSWVSLRDIKLVVIVIFAGIYSAILSLSIVWWAGSPVDAILFTMPSLVYVATTSGAIHLSNYYRDVLAEGGPAEGAAGKALRHAALPLGLATGTTAVGLLTLCYTELVPIRIFGFYSAVGVVVSGILLVFFIPAALELWKPRLKVKPVEHHEQTSQEMLTGSGFWWRAGESVIRNHAFFALACFAIMGLIGYGMIFSETSVQLMKLLSPKEQIHTDYAFLERELGPLVPMEIVVYLPKDDELAGMNFLERLRFIENIQRDVEAMDEIGGTMSTVTFASNLELKDGPLYAARESTLNKRLTANRDKFLHGDYLKEQLNPKTGKTEELWRISARVSALKNVDYDKFIDTLQARVTPLIEEAQAEGTQEIRVVYTGVVPLVYKAQRSLVTGLLIGFLTDFALIVAVMMIACRDWSAGAVLLFPCAFPAIVVFGAMGWIHFFLKRAGVGDLYIDIGYVMAPCVALGVTVDDVVHFMLWFRKGIADGLTRQQAVMLAYKGCARAMYQSWGVIGIGLAVFSLSPFMPTRNFGIMMISMLTIALIGNLLMMPAMLAGPGGALFALGVRRKEDAKLKKQQASTAPSMLEPIGHATNGSNGTSHVLPYPTKRGEAVPEPHHQTQAARRK